MNEPQKMTGFDIGAQIEKERERIDNSDKQVTVNHILGGHLSKGKFSAALVIAYNIPSVNITNLVIGSLVTTPDISSLGIRSAIETALRVQVGPKVIAIEDPTYEVDLAHYECSGLIRKIDAHPPSGVYRPMNLKFGDYFKLLTDDDCRYWAEELIGYLHFSKLSDSEQIERIGPHENITRIHWNTTKSEDRKLLQTLSDLDAGDEEWSPAKLSSAAGALVAAIQFLRDDNNRVLSDSERRNLTAGFAAMGRISVELGQKLRRN